MTTVSFSLAILVGWGAPAPQDPSEAASGATSGATSEVEPGLSFGEAITKRERDPLQAHFEQVLAEACVPPPCLENCTDEEARIGVEIRGDDRNYTLEWSAEDPRLDAPLTLVSHCELCSLVEVQDQLASDLGSLCTRLGALDAGPGRVRVNSSPSGAVVRVDGRKVGRTPWVGEVEAGEHVIEVDVRGYEAEPRTLHLVGGVEESLSFVLMPDGPVAAVGKHPWWPGWTGIGAGVVLGIAGTALIAIDGKEWTANCDDAARDDVGNCPSVYDTRSLGIALASLGAGAFGAGVGLMIWAQDGQYSASVAIRGRF